MNTAHTIEQIMEKIRHIPVERVSEVEDFVDFLNEKATRQLAANTQATAFDFPIISVGCLPEGLNLERGEEFGVRITSKAALYFATVML